MPTSPGARQLCGAARADDVPRLFPEISRKSDSCFRAAILQSEEKVKKSSRETAACVPCEGVCATNAVVAATSLL